MGADIDRIYGTYAEELVIGSGVTATISPLPGQNAGVLKLLSGGTLWILSGLDSTYGSSFSVANRYLVGSSDILNLDISGPLILNATGATCRASLLRGRSAGY